jgi:hypothetical protein
MKIAISTGICNTCGIVLDEKSEGHDCALVLLGRARWLILHYAHRFEKHDRQEALPLVEQIAQVLSEKMK